MMHNKHRNESILMAEFVTYASRSHIHPTKDKLVIMGRGRDQLILSFLAIDKESIPNRTYN